LPPTVLFLLKGYPRLSETFIAQEIRALELRGLKIAIASMRHPTDRARHPIHREIAAPVAYLPEYLYQEPARVFRAWRRVRGAPGYRRAWAAWLADLRRDFTAHRGRRFGQALVLAAELPEGTARLHAHFLHTPASVARYASLMTGVAWSASAHARDIWTTPDWDLEEKLADARWVVTCTAAGEARLAGLARDPGKVELVYHGLDLARFDAPVEPRPGGDGPGGDGLGRDGSDARDPVIVLSVGRAVSKKGYHDLLQALARIPRPLAWRFIHVGGGMLSDALKAEARRLGIDERVLWLGAKPQDEVLRLYRAADLFALACRIAEDGDRDGLPNVLMEAQSQALAVVSTSLSAVPEFVMDGTTGLLVPPGDVDALAAAITELIRDPARRAALGRAGNERVRRHFDMERGIDRLARKFDMPVD
jgi:glycosyltransferase involved in cell wall biosynthesis